MRVIYRVLFAPQGAKGQILLALEAFKKKTQKAPREKIGLAKRGPVTEDPDLAVQSLEALAATNAETVLPGHGEPWPHGVTSAVDIARRDA